MKQGPAYLTPEEAAAKRKAAEAKREQEQAISAQRKQKMLQVGIVSLLLGPRAIAPPRRPDLCAQEEALSITKQTANNNMEPVLAQWHGICKIQ